jgi:hypothetical protein
MWIEARQAADDALIAAKDRIEAHNKRIEAHNKRIAELEAEAALAGMWEQRATELDALLARAMPLLKLGRDGDALYRELERIGIEPVEADAVQCRVVVE